MFPCENERKPPYYSAALALARPAFPPRNARPAHGFSRHLGGAGNSKAGVPSGFVPFERRGNAPPPAHVIVRIPPRASARPRACGAKSAQTPIFRQNRAFPATSDQTELRGIPGGGAGRRNAKDRALIGPETAELETTYFMNRP